MKKGGRGVQLLLTRFPRRVFISSDHQPPTQATALVGKAPSYASHQSRITVHVSRYLATSLLLGFLISLRKLFPCRIAPPKLSAIVGPISASVSRTPRFTPAPPPGEYASIGTYSREWSVVGQRGSGSHPWSAVIINHRDRARRVRHPHFLRVLTVRNLALGDYSLVS